MAAPHRPGPPRHLVRDLRRRPRERRRRGDHDRRAGRAGHLAERERLLIVSSALGDQVWKLSLELEGGSDGAGGAAGDLTHLALRHHDVPADMVEHIGPGWEWYLDRLVGAVTGMGVPGMDVWDAQYMSRAPEYAALGR